MTVIRNLDTAYLFAHCKWKAAVAEELNAARAALLGSNARRDVVKLVEEYLSTCPPAEEAELRAMPFFELVEHIKSATGNEFQDQAPVYVVQLGGLDFQAIPWSPRRGCGLQLQRDGVTVHVRASAPKPNSPNCYIEIGSLPFWTGETWRSVLLGWQRWLNSLLQTKEPLRISRVDIAHHTDVIQRDELHRDNFHCQGDDRIYKKSRILAALEKAHMQDEAARHAGRSAHFVADLIDEWSKEMVWCDWYKGAQAQMISFGTRNRLYARIYHKSTEVARNPVKAALFREVWAAAGLDQENVHNVEFELGRSWLNSRELVVAGKAITIDTIQDLILHFEALCSYLLGSAKNHGWLRMIDNNVTRKRRARTALAWELVREAQAILPEVTAQQRAAKLTRATASRVVPAAVELMARMDAFLGRPNDPERVTAQTILEGMAEVLSYFHREDTVWDEPALQDKYRATRARIYCGVDVA